MGLFAKLGRSSDLVQGMASRLGIDYGEMVAGDPQVQGQKYMRAVLRCSTCRNQDGCSDLQRETTELAKAPSYCRNAQLLAHLRGS
ncbi:DUF6455 family protein [Leisingera sp. ANG-M6]|uniref:DUF6455 family protein n=1 Tax=Leisingera sp. ANG-M6 TaxID=1577900 RepID=UPI00057DA56E|nr:DUF6455 family protein [Leisingera sp. ANG-M6]KIC30084.1 adenylosuccinate lyase [Leisingera sp. ANG-M6]